MKYKKKHLQVIKNLQLSNGGILATPSKEAYPYVYPRDGVFVTKAYNRLKLYKKSEQFYYFLYKHTRLHHFREVFHRYTAKGLPSVTRKHQHDNSGLVIHGICDTYKKGKNKEFIEVMWPFLHLCVKHILSVSRSGLVMTERSIHEFFRLEHGYEIWANSISVRALYDAAEIAKDLNHKKEAKDWKSRADLIKKNMLKKMVNKKTGLFVKNIKYPNAPDMTILAPFYFEIVDNKRLLKKHMKYLKEVLWNTEVGGFNRFRQFEVCKDWHWYTGGNGSWVVFTIWAASFYKKLGDMKNYKLCVKWLNKVMEKTNGLLPEHIALKSQYELWLKNETEFNSRVNKGIKNALKISKKTKNDIIYWATPLGWSHAEYLLAFMK